MTYRGRRGKQGSQSRKAGRICEGRMSFKGFFYACCERPPGWPESWSRSCCCEKQQWRLWDVILQTPSLTGGKLPCSLTGSHDCSPCPGPPCPLLSSSHPSLLPTILLGPNGSQTPGWTINMSDCGGPVSPYALWNDHWSTAWLELSSQTSPQLLMDRHRVCLTLSWPSSP